MNPGTAPARTDGADPSAGVMRGVVIMATYNEAGSIAAVLDEVAQAVRSLEQQGIVLDVLIVDDNSPDGTAQIAKDVAAVHRIRLEVLSGTKEGLGAALVRGFRYVLDNAHANGGADRPAFLVTLDADGQHDARQIPGLVEAFIFSGSGVMIGSRWVKGGSSPGTSAIRTLLSRGGNLLFRAVTGTRGVRDATTSFRVIRPDVAELFDPSKLRVAGYGFFSAFIALAQANGYDIHESPIIFRPRSAGLSKLTLSDCGEFFVNLFAVRKVARVARRQHQSAFQAPDTSADFGAASEQERLSDAKRFNAWIAELLTPALGARVLDVGSGIAAVTKLLALRPVVQSVLAIEPAANIFPRLEHETAAIPKMHCRQITTTELRHEAGPAQFDAITYVNVLEHIEHDVEELRTAHVLLAPGGRIGVFVPAAPWLYGSMDRLSGHHRRYTKATLREAAQAAGFRVDDLHYVDVASMLPYWGMYRVLQANTLGGGSGFVFDSVLVPISRFIQRLVPNPPFGKNLILIATRV